ncbi:ABC transporter permease [Neomoorella thermoacetica]|uniref:Aliphatic sulfonates transport permease protein SsuC n=2 Tax=Neomoorella thermoacetica TaxID=1525 RepID=A0AAC9MVY2_NEOTH|nr:ABC transporter permease [Moorella thermoacetica]AKX97438.1 putative aliphatic sulfonates transport permease protein SsuC [Moorella thermoacetica]AOQ24947.1 Putative aliphatic sulfonates transport permease protein SsuC [Moorella thermoacetica]APC09228.1 putative aliphatic sulfonates transport permease protein SsuC [Moorella thermoacetica]TYL10425.1 putative aliphatic sulfonates transport permease protein SsuC [Moorella thermoacetica]TYL10650.1 putative aliphatic sulfonates transport permeas
MKMRKDDWQRLWQGVLALSVFILIWYTASITGLFGRVPRDYSLLLLPPPGKILVTIFETLVSGYLLKHVLISLARVGLGFTIAVAIGVPLGLAMALVPLVNNLVEPFVRIFGPIPGIAWVPLAILWFGLGDKAAIFIITMGSVFPVLINTYQGMKDVDQTLIEAARTMGAGPWQLLSRVILPSLIPYLVTGFRVGLGFAWRVVIAAEMVGVPNGLGYMLGVGRGTGRTDITIITMVVLGAIMLVVEELIFAPLERRTRFWRRSVRI